MEADPRHANTHYNYGTILEETERDEEAEEQYKLAMEADPSDATTHYNYGHLLKKWDVMKNQKTSISLL